MLNPGLSRRIVYPLVFRLRGEPVFSCLPRIAQSQWDDAAAVEQRQLQRLEELVGYFGRTNAVYGRLLAETSDREIRIQDLSDCARLPILEKSHLHEMVNDFRQSRKLGRRVSVRLTGGSSGAPAAVLVDPAASAMSLAARAVCQQWYGLEMGHRQIRLWGRPLASGSFQESLKDFLLNRVRLDSLALEPSRLAGTLDRISRFGAEYLYGYSSLIQLLAEKALPSQLAAAFPGLRAVITTSETMLDPQREKLAGAFGCPIVDEYGCSEVDIISFQCPAGGRHVVAENVLVEVWRDGDEPEGFGQVLVTDLNNRTTPVIRYRLGDLVPLERPACSCGRGWPCLGQVLGRSQGQYIVAPGQGLVHSQMVVYLIENMVARGVGISRFKIIQEDRTHLRVLLVPSGQTHLDTADLEKSFSAEGRAVLGPEMDWTVELTTIEALEKSRANKYEHFESRISP